MIKIPAKPISYSPTKRNLNNIKFIVIHYTAGNGDTAENEGRYFASGNTRSAGAHFFVGQDGTIVKSVNLSNAAWSVGGKKYADCAHTGGGKFYGNCTNINSVSIELCDNLYKDPSKKQIAAVKKLIKNIRKSCPNAKTVIRHFDVTGKSCPARMVDAEKWRKFLSDIGETTTAKNGTTTFKIKVIVDELNVRSGAGVTYKTVTKINKNEVYTITAEKNRWGKLKSGIGWINISSKYVKRI